MSRPTYAVLSIAALCHNVACIRSVLKPTVGIIAMIKANAYGHGLRSVATILEPIVDQLGVASLDEALILRKQGVKKPIILMEGVFESDEWPVIAHHHLHAVIHQPYQHHWLEASRVIPKMIWLKINTGLGRLGFSLNEAMSIYYQLHQHNVGILSHLACANTPNHERNQKQLQYFERSIQHMPCQYYSLCNSEGLFHFPQHHYHYVRPGLALYGIGSHPDLKPVMTLYSAIIAIQHCQQGDTIGYGAHYICPENMLVGIVAIGYGDGYPKTTQPLPVMVGNTLCYTIGDVSMDMIAIDLRQHPSPTIGQRVTLWGGGYPSIVTLAQHVGRTSYDLLCGLQNRVQCIWQN
jgi:alanine racemase